MAYATSSAYKNKIYAEDSSCDLKIYINNTQIDPDYVREVKLDDSVFESDAFTLGSAIIQKVTLKLDNSCLPCLPSEITNVKIDFVLDLGNYQTETIPIGLYELGSDPDTSNDDYTILNLYDYMNRFDKEYDGSSIVPCTRYELLEDMCSFCGVELGSTSFLNGDIVVNTFDSTIKAKTYLSFISERAGGFAKIGRDGKLYIKSFADVDTIQVSGNDTASVNINSCDNLKTITKLIYEDALNKYEAGNNNGLTVFLSSENPFTITENEFNSIFDSIDGLSFQSIDLKMWGDPAYDTGDIIEVLGMRSFIQKKWSYQYGFTGDYKTNLKESNSISNVEKISNKTNIRKIQSTLNEITGEIDIITEDVSDTKSNIAEMQINLTGINTRVEETSENLASNYLTKDEVEAISNTNNENIDLLRQAVEQSTSSTQYQINVINEEISKGITKIRTNTGFTFDDEGMKIAKEGEEMSSMVDNTGLYVKRDTENVLVANNEGVETENLKVRTYFTIGKNSRFEDYKEERTACFYIGGVDNG